MVFLPMPAYRLSKLLNIDSGCTLIISTFLFINQRIVSACVSFQIEKTAHVRRLIAHNHDVLSCTQKSDLHLCKQSL